MQANTTKPQKYILYCKVPTVCIALIASEQMAIQEKKIASTKVKQCAFQSIALARRLAT